jgi:hypothetical protein
LLEIVVVQPVENRDRNRGALMKSFVIAAAVGVSLATGSAHAQTAIQPGLWEMSDKTTMEGVQPMPTTARRVCVKADEATLERLIYPTPDDFAKHGCSFTPGAKQEGIFKATTACPATDQTPGVTADAEISYKLDSYEGLGQLTVKGKDGTTIKGSSVLKGKRIGDC